jgi:chromosome segregation ATPase
MNVISQLWGRKAPNSDAIFKEISAHNAEKAKEQDRAERAKATLANVAVLTDAEHEAAESDLASATRAIKRLEARIAQLQEAHSAAQKDEALATLKARAEAAKRRVEGEAPKLLDRYEATTRAIVEAVSELQAIDVEVEAVNAELRKAGLDLIETVENRYRREPDQVIPEVRTKRKKWVRRDRWGGEQDVSITIERDGRRLPPDGHGVLADAYEVEVEDVKPAQTKPGRWLDALAGSVRLPPARIGSAWHWPQG